MKALTPLGLIAGLLAVTSAPVHAQSVTLYGLVDLGVSKISRGAYLMGANSTSRIGFRGQEDLGGGLKALFQLESELAADSGTIDSAAYWGRQAWVGLSDDWGLLRLGRTKNIMDGLSDDIDPFQTDGIVGDNTKVAWRAGVIGSRVSNAVAYTTPKWGGFRMQGHAVFDELSSGGKKGWAVTASYDGGNFGLLAGYEKPAVTTAGRAQDKAWIAGAWVSFAGLRLSAGISDGDQPRNKRSFSGLLVGAEYALSPNSKLLASYSKLKRDTSGVKRDDNEGWGLGYNYSMSKRTTLYARLMHEKVADVNGTQVGVTHRF